MKFVQAGVVELLVDDQGGEQDELGADPGFAVQVADLLVGVDGPDQAFRDGWIDLRGEPLGAGSYVSNKLDDRGRAAVGDEPAFHRDAERRPQQRCVPGGRGGTVELAAEPFVSGEVAGRPGVPRSRRSSGPGCQYYGGNSQPGGSQPANLGAGTE